MSLFPTLRLSIKSSRSLSNESQALANAVDCTRSIKELFVGTSQTNKSFAGSADSSDFKIYRINGYRNAFLPVISGELKPFGTTASSGSDSDANPDSGTEIKLFFELHKIAKLFILAWHALAIGTFACLSFEALSASNANGLSWFDWTLTSAALLLTLLIGQLLCKMAFKRSAAKDLKLFLKAINFQAATACRNHSPQ